MNQKQFIEKKIKEFEEEFKNSWNYNLHKNELKVFLSTTIKEANENMWDEIKREKEHPKEQSLSWNSCVNQIEEDYNSFKE